MKCKKANLAYVKSLHNVRVEYRNSFPAPQVKYHNETTKQLNDRVIEFIVYESIDDHFMVTRKRMNASDQEHGTTIGIDNPKYTCFLSRNDKNKPYVISDLKTADVRTALNYANFPSIHLGGLRAVEDVIMACEGSNGYKVSSIVTDAMRNTTTIEFDIKIADAKTMKFTYEFINGPIIHPAKKIVATDKARFVTDYIYTQNRVAASPVPSKVVTVTNGLVDSSQVMDLVTITASSSDLNQYYLSNYDIPEPIGSVVTSRPAATYVYLLYFAIAFFAIAFIFRYFKYRTSASGK